MQDTTMIVSHIPAMKVGGRRYSASGRHRTHSTGTPHIAELTTSEMVSGETTMDDYPRPAPPGQGQVHQHEGHNQYQDEEQTGKDKKHPHQKMKEYAHWKAETTRPTRGAQANIIKVCGAGGRIAQPAGKGI